MRYHCREVWPGADATVVTGSPVRRYCRYMAASLSYQALTAMPICQGRCALHRASTTLRPGSMTTISAPSFRYRSMVLAPGREWITYTSTS